MKCKFFLVKVDLILVCGVVVCEVGVGCLGVFLLLDCWVLISDVLFGFMSRWFECGTDLLV